VVVSGRSEQRGAEVIKKITAAGGRASFIAADLDGSADASRALAAGVSFDLVYAVNVKAPFFLTAAIAPAMAANGGGAIINLGSWIARLGIPVGALYSSTKGAMETLTRAWAAEFGPAGVRVNAISPGVTHEPVPGEDYPGDAMMKGTPAGRPGSPAAVAHAAVYLASDEAASVHGTVIDVDGGRVGVAVLTP
jgi:NAD(P)-dependent dehydrogenase (short-subunit alcohol dehydrogenase family)